MQYTASAPTKLLEIARLLFPESSRRTLQHWIRAGRFSVDAQPIMREDLLIHAGQTVSSDATCRPPKVPGVPILYEDRHLIVIDKPEGLLSVPLDGRSQSGRHALGLLRRYLDTDQIFAVHRIDRETSGVLLFARGKESAEKLNILFENHDLKRQYFAIVQGRMEPTDGIWNTPLKELSSYSVIAALDGKPATTHFRVLRRSAKYSYLSIELETGRKHQIRVHCQLAGHPVLGDRRYGATESPIGRLCLHARLLEFVHPFTKKLVSFTSPTPTRFNSLGGTTSCQF